MYSGEEFREDELARRSFSSLVRVGIPLFGVAYYLYLRPHMRKAGTRYDESTRPLPGDDLIASPNFEMTRAVNIDAAPDAVWPWIAQIGRNGTGFYGLDSLTNQGVPSAAYLRTDLPAPQRDDVLDGGYRTLALEPGHYLLYGGFDLPTPTGGTTERTTLLLLERRENDKTRLLVRTRGYTYGIFGPVYNLFYELADYWHGMAQLRNIRQRAEMLAQLSR